MYPVVGGNGALTGVMRKAAAPRAGVECQDGVGTQCAKTQGRDIEYAGLVRLSTIGADGDAKVVRSQLGGGDRVVDPLVAFGVHVQQGAEGALVGIALGALVHQGTLGA